MTIQDQRRKGFEACMGPILRKEGIGEPDKAFDKDQDGRYYRNYVYSAWLAWNAALDSLVIELPERANGTTADLPGWDGNNDYMYPETPLLVAFEAAGLKVKP